MRKLIPYIAICENSVLGGLPDATELHYHCSPAINLISDQNTYWTQNSSFRLKQHMKEHLVPAW
jgi:hypothetical protein